MSNKSGVILVHESSRTQGLVMGFLLFSLLVFVSPLCGAEEDSSEFSYRIFGPSPSDRFSDPPDRLSAPSEFELSETPEQYRRFLHLQAADKSDAEIQFALGRVYDFGEGVPEDDIEAVYWYTKAAEQGHVEAKYNLGIKYYRGEGVDKDYAEAVNWWEKAAEQGYADAQYYLGFMYYEGRGVTKDNIQAFRWYTEAAEQEHAVAQGILGVMYLEGKGIAGSRIENEVQAYAWFNLSAASGYEPAFKIRDVLEGRLESDQISAGQERARALQGEIQKQVDKRDGKFDSKFDFD